MYFQIELDTIHCEEDLSLYEGNPDIKVGIVRPTLVEDALSEYTMEGGRTYLNLETSNALPNIETFSRSPRHDTQLDMLKTNNGHFTSQHGRLAAFLSISRHTLWVCGVKTNVIFIASPRHPIPIKVDQIGYTISLTIARSFDLTHPPFFVTIHVTLRIRS